jgi:hypothetical protein
MKRINRLVLLKINARQAKRRFVAHRLIHFASENRLDRSSGPEMHSIVEFEITDGELGLADVVMQGIKLRFVQAVVLPQLGVQQRYASKYSP